MNIDFSLSFSTRFYALVPPWFGSDHPTLDAKVAGYAAAHEAVAAQITDLIPFTRLADTTGELLDLAAFDFTGRELTRNIGEIDSTFDIRLRNSLFQTSGTRTDFIRQIIAATGTEPVIFDPRVPNDTGTLGNVDEGVVPTLFYNTRGGLTNYNLGYQWFARITNTSAAFTTQQLYSLIASIMPAGTVCWTHIN